ncbi:DJ-1/PfpI family protein [Algoriphagus sp.]|uniref:DJ-1/PfpI family protein n=1 Tax=Algoriphagus sp. TaxID=1872435 RepID=UPI0027254939|nr:DJ-1/PfpI family protein [Algoriphagus sp.]MDO8968110.1 DJ-1/PfpI family protein [Algoriphagus sp.]MDP3202211.1 DJ-1/PfpI family protein [Algoriphagus sp.]
MKRLGIFIFYEVEVLDFAGPFEVFSVGSQLSDYSLLKVFTFGADDSLIRTKNGLQVKPDFGISELLNLDFLVLPGGDGSKKVIQDSDLLFELESLIQNSRWTMSVCSGSRILAKTGFLKGKPYCTHHEVFESMKEIVPDGIPKPELRFVQSNDKIWTAAGISAGIDLSLYLLEKTFGEELALKTAKYMEYQPYLDSK